MRCTEKMRIMEILRRWEMGLTQREIAKSVNCGKSTVGEIQHRCMDAAVTYDQASHLTNNEIRQLLHECSFTWVSLPLGVWLNVSILHIEVVKL